MTQYPPDLMPLSDLLDHQEGVIARRQFLASGLLDQDIRRFQRRRVLARVHPGVWLSHTGAPSWPERAWAAVLYAEPAALAGASVLHLLDRDAPDPEVTIHLAIPPARSIVLPPGVKATRVTDLDQRVIWNARPPRLRVEEAVLDLAAAAADDTDAVGWLTRPLHRRHTTALRIQDALARRRRVPRRAFLDRVLRDLASGTCSVLEHAFLTRVQRPHGLPEGEWQQRAERSRIVYHDFDVGGLPAAVELDGFAYHSSPGQFAADLARDLDAAADGIRTIRLGYAQVLSRSCETASRLAQAWRHLGWQGQPRTCPSCP